MPRRSCCGQNFIREVTLRSKELSGFFPDYTAGATASEAALFAGYLGSVKCPALKQGNQWLMESTLTIGGKRVQVKCVDAQEHRLKPETRSYSLNQLKYLSPAKVDANENAHAFHCAVAVHKVVAKMDNDQAAVKEDTDHWNEYKRTHPNVPGLSAFINKTFGAQKDIVNAALNEQPPVANRTNTLKTYLKAVEQMVAVDTQWNFCEFVRYLHVRTGFIGLGTPGDAIVIIVNVPGFDNAYFSGSYFCIGSGGRAFGPMSAPDVCGHEAFHSVTQALGGLTYRNESGMINEHMADAFGVDYEFHIYEKFNRNQSKDDDLKGKGDWELGEDEALQYRVLRDMAHPASAPIPQPEEYKGEHWPTGSGDNGGVHSGSGVGNRAFYLTCTAMGTRDMAVSWWFNAHQTLRPNATYFQLREALLKVSGNHPAVRNALVTVKLLEGTPIPVPDPVDPPTDPTDPVDPPTDPTDPTDPVDPPTDPTDPPDLTKAYPAIPFDFVPVPVAQLRDLHRVLQVIDWSKLPVP